MAKKSNTKTLKFLVIRQEAFKVGPVIVVTAVVKPFITSDTELVEELKIGVTKWIRRTKEGRKAWELSSSDINIGDLSSYDLKPILKYCPNIISLDWEQVDQADNWVYDTVLANQDEIENGSYEES